MRSKSTFCHGQSRTQLLHNAHLAKHRLQFFYPYGFFKVALHPVENPDNAHGTLSAGGCSTSWKALASSGSILRRTKPFASSEETQWLIFPRVV